MLKRLLCLLCFVFMAFTSVGCGVLNKYIKPTPKIPSDFNIDEGMEIKPTPEASADFDGDGRMETVKLITNNKNEGLRAALFDSDNNILWISEDNNYDKYSSCLIADINDDNVPELIFSGDKDGETNNYIFWTTSVLYWKHGSFTQPTKYYIWRSAEDTTEFLWIESADSTLDYRNYLNHEFYSRHPEITQSYKPVIYNLRRINNDIWGDLLLKDKNRIIGKVRLVPSKNKNHCILKGVEQRDACNADSCLMALPWPAEAKLEADLNNDGRMETISFKSYYPTTGMKMFLQIIVSDKAGKTIWESPRKVLKERNDNEKLKPEDYGISIWIDSGKGAAISSALISDIDNDGYQELVASTWERGYDRIEIWRWQDGAFHFVRSTRLMLSATDANTYLFVDPNNVDTDERIYKRLNYSPEFDYTSTERISVSNLRMCNGEIWGITGGCCQTDLVKLVTCKGGMKAIETKPYEGFYWEQ